MEENKQKKEEGCPLCRVSEETIEKLKNNKQKDPPSLKLRRARKKPLWKLW